MAWRLFSWKLNAIHYILLNEGITIYLNLRISILYSKYRSFNSNIESGKWIPFHRKGRSVVTAPVSTEHHEISRDHPSMEPWRGMWNPQIIRWLLVPEPDRRVLFPLRWLSRPSLSSLRYICTLIVYIFMWHSLQLIRHLLCILCYIGIIQYYCYILLFYCYIVLCVYISIQLFNV